jgi:DNA repair protein RecN (Recombination protein N)
MATRHRALVELEERLAASRAGADGAAARRELLGFQLQEIMRVAPREGESEELEREREVLRHAERLRSAAADAEAVLYAGYGAVLDVVARHAERLRALGEIDPIPTSPSLDEVRPVLEDAALRAGSRACDQRGSAARQIEERIATLQRLARKYGCTPGERRAAGRTRARAADSATAVVIPPSSRPRSMWPQSTPGRCGGVDARPERGSCLGERITAARELALGGARVQLALEPISPGPTALRHVRDGRALSAAGTERVAWLSRRARELPRPLAKVSGGELSRIMLAIKAATAVASDVPTLLFDEVDAGIGGAVAETVGRKLAALATGRQVICITHLPQIAACADHHFVVRKRAVKGRTRSSAERLSDSERVEELARMLAGVTVTKRHAGTRRSCDASVGPDARRDGPRSLTRRATDYGENLLEIGRFSLTTNVRLGRPGFVPESLVVSL